MGGGAGLAIAGDLAVMAQDAKLSYPETKHGIVAALVLGNLVRQVGRKAAFELVAFGEPIDGHRAMELGMVNYVFDEKDVLPEAIKLAQRLCTVDRTALAETKKLFHEVADLPLGRALELGRDMNMRMRNFDKLDGARKK